MARQRKPGKIRQKQRKTRQTRQGKAMEVVLYIYSLDDIFFKKKKDLDAPTAQAKRGKKALYWPDAEFCE